MAGIPESRTRASRGGTGPWCACSNGQVLALRRLRPEEATVVVEVATRPRTLRVADVVNGLRAVSADAAPLTERRVVRTHQWIERGGARHEPLDVDRRSAAPSGAEAHTLEACA